MTNSQLLDHQINQVHFIFYFIKINYLFFIRVSETEATKGHSCHWPLYAACHSRGHLRIKNNPGSVSLLYASGITLIIFFPSCQDSELTELKDTIDILKAKNTEAQEIIQGALSNPDITPKGKEHATHVRYEHVRISKLPFLTIQYHLFLPYPRCEEMLINRQNSSESIATLTSTASHSSMGSLKEQEAKKKKKKSWVGTRSLEKQSAQVCRW